MPAPADTDAAATTDLANELRPILVRLGRELRKETSHLGITGGQATLLWQVAENPGIGLRALAELEGIATPTVSGLIDRLQRAGLVTRERSQTDRRRIGLMKPTAIFYNIGRGTTVEQPALLAALVIVTPAHDPERPRADLERFGSGDGLSVRWSPI